MNIYAYVRGDPVNGSDPSGLAYVTEVSPLVVIGGEPRGTSQSAATFAGQFDNLFGQMTEAQASAALDAQELARLTNCPRGATTQFFTDKKGDQIGLPAMKTGTSLVFRGLGPLLVPLLE